MPSDSELVTKIRTGKGDPQLFGANDFVYLPALMGGIQADAGQQFTQVMKGMPATLGPVGSNNI